VLTHIDTDSAAKSSEVVDIDIDGNRAYRCVECRVAVYSVRSIRAGSFFAGLAAYGCLSPDG